MIPNEKSLNYKVVDLVEVYNFRINFIPIRIYMNLHIFLKMCYSNFSPDEPAVCFLQCTFRRMNWRQDDIFVKKNSAYIFD